MFKTTLLSAITLILMSTTTFAMSTFELIEDCSIRPRSVEESEIKSFCIGYITGSVDSLSLTIEYFKKDYFCLPKDIDIYKIFKDVKGLAYSDKEVLNATARVSILLSLKRMYPCK